MNYISIKETNEILHYLDDVILDRLYLNQFNNVESITNSNNDHPILQQKPIYHQYSFLFEDTEDVIFKFNTADLRNFDKLEISILTSVELDLNDILVYFSEFANANVPLEHATVNKDKTTVDNNLYNLVFDLKDENGANYYLPNVNSIKLILGQDVRDLWIANIVIKSEQYNLVLDELKPALNNAEDYIINKIPNEDSVPSQLLKKVSQKAASMLWLIARQEKGESNVGTEGMRFSPSNFHDKTKKEVDDAINNYLDMIEENEDRKRINEDMVGFI